ncbi:hypothetical protein BT96DRAFT_1059585 [Gymnopus androsaceus JB14]|uniref:P-loop containing nucleoside triphosphate hydrolase protein n=1 Tax=Gymnopus androsaceus JB14 TaxID=1447944 RepID=A0A6A4H146_9AGAR|nr:hypothetical protein BT96DRAFT_1059585 [Gymnopus androsaceus JB14]
MLTQIVNRYKYRRRIGLSGLDYCGKTALVHKLKHGEAIETVPTIKCDLHYSRLGNSFLKRLATKRDRPDALPLEQIKIAFAEVALKCSTAFFAVSLTKDGPSIDLTAAFDWLKIALKNAPAPGAASWYGSGPIGRASTAAGLSPSPSITEDDSKLYF